MARNRDLSKLLGTNTNGVIDNSKITLDANEIPNIDASKITSGDIALARLGNVPASDNASALTTGTIPDARLSNQVKTVKSGSAPSNPQEGDLWYDTSNDILKVYDTTDNIFVKVVRVNAVLSSITGNIITATAGNLTLNGSGFMSANLIVSFTPSGGSASTVTVTPTSDTAATVAIPSAIYGQSASTVIGIKVTNEDAKTSSTVNETVIDIPSGGTITTHGSYRVHTFLSSANFVVPSGFSRSMDTLIVAGGGAGGNWHAGGGGAGGMITYNTTPSAGTYSMTVGAGGAGGTTSVGSQGGSSVAFSQSTVGGGRGGNYSGGTLAGNGGSGAGGNGEGSSRTKGSGTAGQGNDGGDGFNGSHAGGGGGGKGATGATAPTNQVAGNGGIGGTNDYRTGSAVYYAGGGGGGVWANATKGTGGNGGGGNGSWNGNNNAPTAGTANTGGGGGGSGAQGNNTSYAAQTTGGSGIIVVRYTL